MQQPVLPVILSLVLALMLCRCLAPDPELEPLSETGNEEIIAQREIITRAPLIIAPAILANRTFNEAPMLAAKVKAGELPPVSERLPDNPLVVVPLEEIGNYGGNDSTGAHQ